VGSGGRGRPSPYSEGIPRRGGAATEKRTKKKLIIVKGKMIMKSEHELLEEAQWKKLFELGNGDVSMLLMFVQKLCAVFHVFDPANDLLILDEDKWIELQPLLKARIIHVIDWAEKANLDHLDGIRTLKEISANFYNLGIDSLKGVTEDIHQANHALTDQLERELLN